MLAVTGSIAAYKSAQIVRLLVKEGAEVKVIMTAMAKNFITPLTMATLSKNPILVDFYNPENGDWNSHVKLGIWADLYLIAPATANTLSKMAFGIADNLLLTSYLSARCPVAVAPAMDLDMYRHPATAASLEMLKSRGVFVIEPASGELASGLEGKGRMEEPENIVRYAEYILSKKTLEGKRIMVTAGPTREPMDPVRYISNHSSGKMGYAIAKACADRGAQVCIISGPVSIGISHPNIRVARVSTASEMCDAALEEYAFSDAAIMCAAVADYSPAVYSDMKIKRTQGSYSLELTPNRDIAAEIGKIKRKGTFTLGFALETDNEIENAVSKMKKKNLDAIVLNSLKDEGAGFSVDTNKISILSSDGKVIEGCLKSKAEVAEDIADYVESKLTCL